MYGCNLEPIHKNNKEDKLFCAIELQQPKSNLIEHEIFFYNNLKTKFKDLDNRSLSSSLFSSGTSNNTLISKSASLRYLFVSIEPLENI